MKRFLYLDCDGVLNGCTKIDDFATHWPPMDSVRRGDPFNRYKVQLLTELVTANDITIIGISSWFGYRLEETLQELRECPYFTLPIHRVSSCTTGGTPRCNAVLDDVLEHNPDYWCILDDGERAYTRTDHRFYDKQPYYDVRQHLVQPKGRYGISEEHVEQIGMILGISKEFYTTALPLGWVEQEVYDVYGRKVCK